MKQTLLLDIMEHGRFVCQIPYNRHGKPKLIDGNIVEVHDYEEFKAYVYTQRPSLRNRDISIAFTSNRVCRD